MKTLKYTFNFAERIFYSRFQVSIDNSCIQTNATTKPYTLHVNIGKQIWNIHVSVLDSVIGNIILEYNGEFYVDRKQKESLFKILFDCTNRTSF